MTLTKQIITLSIQEIVNDFYSLAEEEGFLTGLAEVGACEEEDKKSYHNKMKEMIEKYMPNYKNHIDKRYFADDATEDEKGVILSTSLCENFREIFYGLV